MADDARLQIVLRLKDEASKRMKNIDKSFKQSAKRIGTSAAGGAAVAGAGFVAAGTKMQDWGDGVQRAENTLKMGTGAMGEDLESLMDSTRAVSGQVPQDFGTVAKAVADVSTEFGLSGKPLEEATQMFLDVARVAGTEAGPMIKGVNDVMGIFGEDQTETNRILGDFVKISQETGIPLSKLISDMGTYGPVLKNAGMETDEAAAFIGTLNSNGIEASRIMPGLNARMRALAEGGVTDMATALENDIKFIASATDDTEALNRATEVFGAEGAQRMLAAINAGLIPAHEALVEKTRDSEDEVNNLTDGTLTTGEQMDIMKNKVMAVIAPFADYIALIGAILVPLGALALAIGGVALAATMLSIPLLPLAGIIAAIVAAVVIGVVIFKNWDKIWSALGKTFSFVWGLLDSKLGKLIALFLPFGPLIVGIKLLAENWDAVWNGIKAVVLTVGRPIVGAINGIIGAFNALFDVMRGIELGWDAKKVLGKTVIPAFSIAPFGFLPTIPEIPSFAEGGIVTKPTLAHVGEAGPEAIVPLRAGAGMGTSVTINFPQGSTVILDNESSARSLADQITQQIRGVLRAQGAF